MPLVMKTGTKRSDVRTTLDEEFAQRVFTSWLNLAPEGTPVSAAEWALTLPESQERKDLLGNIHREWKKKDADAAAKFARENGLAE